MHGNFPIQIIIMPKWFHLTDLIITVMNGKWIGNIPMEDKIRMVHGYVFGSIQYVSMSIVISTDAMTCLNTLIFIPK